MTTPLLEGLDGVEKMSKSLGNYIGIEESPKEIYGKAMSISDDLMWRYFELCTDVSVSEIKKKRQAVEKGTLHPRDAKSELAGLLVAAFHDEESAEAARAEFDRVFARKEVPGDAPRIPFALESGALSPIDLVAAVGGTTKSEARRLLAQGGVTFDDRRLKDTAEALSVARGDSKLLKIGKRRFYWVEFE
jgi:tyrosyl-tRNA synthetase